MRVIAYIIANLFTPRLLKTMSIRKVLVIAFIIVIFGSLPINFIDVEDEASANYILICIYLPNACYRTLLLVFYTCATAVCSVLLTFY